MSDIATTSTRPYLIRALHEWCTDNGFTPYVAAHVDGRVQVPMEYVKDQEIVLNVSYDATSSLKLGNDFIEFKARFGGTARDIMVPIDHVVAIYARENGQGMAFPPPQPGEETVVAHPASAPEPDEKRETAAPSPASPVQLVVASSEGDEKKDASGLAQPASDDDEPTPPAPPSPSRPSLKRVK